MGPTVPLDSMKLTFVTKLLLVVLLGLVSLQVADAGKGMIRRLLTDICFRAVVMSCFEHVSRHDKLALWRCHARARHAGKHLDPHPLHADA